MRFHVLFLLLACLVLAGGCAASQGPGASCDVPQAIVAPVQPGSQGAAAAASGGQDANNAPFSVDTARLAPKTTVGNGQGATTSSSADEERRHVASGGAQNLSVVTPTDADAKNLGGSSPAVVEASKTVGSYRAMLQCEMLKQFPDMARIEFLSAQLTAAQEALATAQTSGQTSRVVNNNFQGATVQQFGISTSATGKDEALNPEVVKPMAQAAASLGEAGVMYETASDGDAPAAAEPLPEAPPVEEPAPVDAPTDGG